MVTRKKRFLLKNHLLLAILTRDTPKLLNNLLTSINSHSQFRNCMTLVVDDSTTDNMIDANAAIIQKHNRGFYFHISHANWHLIRNKLVTRPITTDLEQFLQTIVLGGAGYNTYNTRNIVALIAKKYFFNFKHTFFLESDILIPNSFRLHKRDLRKLVGVKIKGSPDLSRFEWMVFYVCYLYKKYRLGIPFSRTNYIHQLVSSLSLSNLALMFYLYTDFFVYNTDMILILKKHHFLSFPVREFNTGSFLVDQELFHYSIFPQIWEDDFCWLNIVRHFPVRQSFLNVKLVQKALKKSVFNQWWLKWEEQGHIFNRLTVFKEDLSKITSAQITKVIQKKIKDNERVVKYSQNLLSHLTNHNEKKQVEKISDCIKHLIQVLNTTSLDFFKDLVNKTLIDTLYWKDILSNIRPQSTHALKYFH